MSESEVYVLCSERSALAANKFLDEVMPHRTSAAADFHFPHLSDRPDVVLTHPQEVIDRLEQFPREPYNLYWHNAFPGEPINCILSYTEDQGLIIGVVVHDHNAEKWLIRLAELTGGKHGYVTGEEVPPETTLEFIERTRRSTVPRMLDGKIEN